MVVGRQTKYSGEAVAAAVNLVAGGLALAPLITGVLALAAPSVRQELSSSDEAARQLTLFGMIGQFDGLESAPGVVPLVLLAVLALVVVTVAASAVLVATRSESLGTPTRSPVVLIVAGAVLVATTMLLLPVLSSADDVANPQPPVDNPYGLTGAGWAHLMLAGVVAIVAGSLIRSARSWLE